MRWTYQVGRPMRHIPAGSSRDRRHPCGGSPPGSAGNAWLCSGEVRIDFAVRPGKKATTPASSFGDFILVRTDLKPRDQECFAAYKTWRPRRGHRSEESRGDRSALPGSAPASITAHPGVSDAASAELPGFASFAVSLQLPATARLRVLRDASRHSGLFSRSSTLLAVKRLPRPSNTSGVPFRIIRSMRFI